MTREFKEGYLYKVSGLPYESDNLSCNVLTEHTFLAFGGPQNEFSFVISEADELDVAEGAQAELVDDLEVGYCENDGTAKFVVVEVNRDNTCVVALIY